MPLIVEVRSRANGICTMVNEFGVPTSIRILPEGAAIFGHDVAGHRVILVLVRTRRGPIPEIPGYERGVRLVRPVAREARLSEFTDDVVADIADGCHEKLSKLTRLD